MLIGSKLADMVAYLKNARGRDTRFDESMKRIDENLEKSDKSKKVIDAWLNRQPQPPTD
jgi:uncharacterized protein YfbU (UPF0304 family)